jgi:outer membrane protein
MNHSPMKLARHFFSPVRRTGSLFVVSPSGGIQARSRLKAELRTLLGAAVIVVSSLAAQPTAQPAVPDTLDLKTAITFALENNFAIRQARERIRQQEGVVIEVTARAIPNVNADAVYQRNDTDIGLSFPPTDRTWQINLTASQVLFAGGGVRSAVKSSKLARDAAMLDLQAVINDALLQVRTAFYTVLLAREQIKVQESNIELLQQQLKTATSRRATIIASRSKRCDKRLGSARTVPTRCARCRISWARWSSRR